MPELIRTATRTSMEVEQHPERIASGSGTRRASLAPPATKHTPKRGNVDLTIIGAEALSKRDKFILPDLFATVSYRGQKIHTTACTKGTLSPVWEATLKLMDLPEGASVLVQVFNQKRLPAMLDPDCFLGESIIPIHLEHSYSQNARLLKSTQFPQSSPIEGTIWVFTCPADVPARRPSRGGIIAAEGEDEPLVGNRETNEDLRPQWGEEVGSAPLPTGWEMRMATSGRPYFVDNEHGTTTWVHPALPESADLVQHSPAYNATGPAPPGIAS